MRRRLLIAVVVVLIWVAGTLPVGAATTSTLIPVGEMKFFLWQSGESFADGSQADIRLDTPVHVWGAGIPLRDLLTDIGKQAGVTFKFWPTDAEEARVCLTLYLNPQHPSALRDVMAQISWVTGCGFGLSDGEEGEKTYYVLGTSVGEGVAEKLAAATQARMEQFRTETENRRASDRATAASALAEAKRALSLSRAEVTAKYRGTNDALLFNLIEPTHRAALRFLTNLSDADTKTLFEGRGVRLTRDWSEWSGSQQAALKQIMLVIMADQGTGSAWPTEGTVTILISVDRGGSIGAMLRKGDDPPQFLGATQGLLASGELRRWQSQMLRQLLGEPDPVPTVEPEGGQPSAQDRQTRRQQQRQQEWEQRRQEFEVQQQQAQEATRALSSARESELEALVLPRATAEGLLWQLQEAVAKATGIHVVSDCFWMSTSLTGNFRMHRLAQGERPAEQDESAAPVDALRALEDACTSPGTGVVRSIGPMGEVNFGLQWGDAGDFLRFRAQRLDIWRAAMLPVNVQQQLDEWLEPYVDETTSDVTTSVTSPLTTDLEKMSWLASRVNGLQTWIGGSIVYGKMTDAKEARRYALRRATLRSLGTQLSIFQLLASFTSNQWEQAKSSGLRWGYDLTPEQQNAELTRLLEMTVPEDKMKDVLLKLGQADAQNYTTPDGETEVISAGPMLMLYLDDALVNEIRLGTGWGPGGMMRTRGPMGGGPGIGGRGGGRGDGGERGGG